MTRMRAVFGCALLLTGMTVAVVLPAQENAALSLRRAMEIETVTGDLEKAIEEYRKLADGSDRAVAAQAMQRMAHCYELLADARAARETYERIIAQFPDQQDVVALARRQLAAAAAPQTALAHAPVWTVTSGYAGEGSVSSDGRYVCFTTDPDEGSFLAVRDLMTGTDRVLANAPKADSSEGCSFSPSGDRIAFAWHDSHGTNWEVRVVAAAGNAAPRTLLKDAFRWFGTPAWSPDGRSIAVQAVEGHEHDGRSEALLVSVDDGAVRVLPSPGAWRMFFSPDGRALALDRRPPGSAAQHDVFVLWLAEGREVNVTEFGSHDIVMGWSPDSSHVLFASDRRGSTGLYAVFVAEGDRQGGPTSLKVDIGDALPMGVTSAGALYHHTTSGGPSSFLEIVECGPGATSCAPPVPLGAAARRSILSWSPDGRYLAYIRPRVPFPAGILTIRSMQTGATHDVLSGTWVQAAVWAPDSRTLAVYAIGGGARLLLIDAERGDVTELGTGMPRLSGPTWSDDQRTLYYRRDLSAAGSGDNAVVLVARDLASGAEEEMLRRPATAPFGAWALSRNGQVIWAMVTDSATQTSELWTVPVGGGDPQVVLRRPAMGGVNVSPDERYIATRSRDASANTTAVLLIPTGGGDPRELIRVTDPSDVSAIFWAPDSRSLYFRRRASTTDTRAELWNVTLDAGEARKVDSAIELEMGLPVALSPDGRRLALIRGDGGEPVTRQVWKLENFLPATATQR